MGLVIGIVGSYRKGGTIDRAVDEILAAAAAKGASTKKYFLLDRHIEYCTGCRICSQAPGPDRGRCVIEDDVDSILDDIDAADGIVLGSPIYIFDITALTRKFMERMVGYAYWPWNGRAPVMLKKVKTKKAVFVVSSAMPAPFARVFTRAHKSLKQAAQSIGAKPVATVFLGMMAQEVSPSLSDREKAKLRVAGEKVAG